MKCISLKHGEVKGKRQQLAAQLWQCCISHHNGLSTVSSHSCRIFSLLFLYDGSGWNPGNLIAEGMPFSLIAGGNGVWWFISAELRGVCCSAAADTGIIVVFWELQCWGTVQQDVTQQSTAREVCNSIRNCSECSPALVWLGSVWGWDSDTRGLNGRADCTEVVSWEGCTPQDQESFPHDKKCLYKCWVKYYHITRNYWSGKFSLGVSSHVGFSSFFCSFKTFKYERWQCEGNYYQWCLWQQHPFYFVWVAWFSSSGSCSLWNRSVRFHINHGRKCTSRLNLGHINCHHPH